MSGSERVEHAALLLERLLADAEFRARFRARPAQVCREAGFTDIAEEITTTPGALHTLEQRESRSSLLGVLMVAALEGAGALEIAHLVGGLSGDARAAAHTALTRSGMRAVGVAPKGAAVSYASAVPGAAGAPAPGAGAAGAGGAVGASGPSAAGAPAAPVVPDAAGASSPSAAAGAPAAPVAPDAAGAAAAPGAPGTPPVATPGATSAPADAAAGGGAPAASGQAWPDSAPAGAVDASGWPVADGPSAAGGGGAEPVALQRLTQNPNITVAPAAQAALGSVDARFAPLLTALARDHRLGIGVGAGGAITITAVDGTPVSTDSPAARELMREIADLDPSQRPSQVGGPWRIREQGFVSGREHESAITLTYAGAPSDSPALTERAVPGGLVQAAEAAAPPHGVGFDVAAAAKDYPGDQASKAQIARWMGDWAQRAGLPRELPVMAALVESDLQNLDHGHADSLGFFQMLTGTWSKQYPDFPHRPELQLKWFIDTATANKGKHSSTDPSQFGDWVADTEKPLAKYRDRYQPRLGEARDLLGQADGSADPPGAGMARTAAATGPAAGTGPAATADPAAAADPAASPYATISFEVPATGAAAPGAGAPADDAAAVVARTAAGIMPGADVTVPGTTPDAVRRIFERAAALDARRLPYVLGGGHSPGVHDVDTVGPVDCSGAVSAVLGVDARVSGAFEAWGEAGPGKYVTIYANDAHILMEINGHFFGTSASNPGGGAGWIPRSKLGEDYLSRFTARHPPGM